MYFFALGLSRKEDSTRVNGMRNRKTMLIFVALIAVLSLCLVTYYKKHLTVDQAKSVAVEVKTVEAIVVKREKVARIVELSAALQPSEESTISFEVSGRIAAMFANVGDQVNAGDVLARQDAREHSLEVSETVTKIDKTRVEYEQAKTDFNRMEQLYSQQAVSRNDYEKARNSFVLAEKDHLHAQQAFSLETDRHLLKSPMSGTVIAKLSSVGQLVVDGEPAVYRVGQVDSLKVLLPVPDRDIAAWHIGDVVMLFLYKDTREGTVTRIFPATNQGTGTISIEVTVNNPSRDWYPGQLVTARRTIDGKEGLFVPVEAVLNCGEKTPYVFLVIEEKAVKKAVTIGELYNNQLEILSGIKEGEQVIIKGVNRLFDGDLIQLARGNRQ